MNIKWCTPFILTHILLDNQHIIIMVNRRFATLWHAARWFIFRIIRKDVVFQSLVITTTVLLMMKMPHCERFGKLDYLAFGFRWLPIRKMMELNVCIYSLEFVVFSTHAFSYPDNHILRCSFFLSPAHFVFWSATLTAKMLFFISYMALY